MPQEKISFSQLFKPNATSLQMPETSKLGCCKAVNRIRRLGARPGRSSDRNYRPKAAFRPAFSFNES